MKKDIAVVGLGIFGFELAIQLEAHGNKVLAVDKNREIVEKIKEHVTSAAAADITNEEVIKDLELNRFDPVILGLGGNFEQLVLGLAYLKKQGVHRVIARTNTDIQKEILLKMGADEVILPEKHAAEHLAERISRPGVKDFLELDADISLVETTIPDRFIGKNLLDLDLRKKHNITALVLKRQDQTVKVITDPTSRFHKGDILVVIGEQKIIEDVFS